MIGWKDRDAAIAARDAEFSGVMDGVLITGQAGFISGTHVASSLGWCLVETLSVGDRVLTFDHGMQTILDIQRETVIAPDPAPVTAHCPVLVPEGTLSNRTDMWLMPHQGMLVESDVATDILGDPFAVVPARALRGFRGIRSVAPSDRLETTTLAFAHDEVVYVEGGMLAFCPRPRCILTDAPQSKVDLYQLLNLRAARFLVGCLIDEDDGHALFCDPDEVAAVATPRRKRARPPRFPR